MAVIVFCSPASAEPIDPDPDGMGIYFDTEGTAYCLTVDDWEPAVGAGPTIDVYLLVTRPDTPYPSILAWETHVEIISNSLIPTHYLTVTPGCAFYMPEEDYVIGCSYAPIPIIDDVAMIASAELSWLGTEGHAEVTFIMRGVQGSLSFPDGPGYASAPGFPSPCQPLFGEWGEVAWVNGNCQTIAGEDMAWGMVKSLY
jgi:hypothetical protein